MGIIIHRVQFLFLLGIDGEAQTVFSNLAGGVALEVKGGGRYLVTTEERQLTYQLRGTGRCHKKTQKGRKKKKIAEAAI